MRRLESNEQSDSGLITDFKALGPGPVRMTYTRSTVEPVGETALHLKTNLSYAGPYQRATTSERESGGKKEASISNLTSAMKGEGTRSGVAQVSVFDKVVGEHDPQTNEAKLKVPAPPNIPALDHIDEGNNRQMSMNNATLRKHNTGG